MQKQYISDVITKEEIDKWTKGNRILITSQTGSGKSYFIKNNVYDYCIKNKLKCLLLSNRSILKNQNIENLDAKTDTVYPMNYQLLENQILNGKNIYQVFAGFDIIVYDEVHYLFNDAIFSRNTDLLIEPIKNPMKDKIFIFITATPMVLLSYQKEYDFVYTTKTDYSYIRSIYFYNGKNIPTTIFQRIPRNDKAIYFGSDVDDIYEVSSQFDRASFICAESNKYYKKSDKEVRSQIENDDKFESKYLCTTKVLDNGINLVDINLKHVIIDILDPITFIQCLGRKRVVSQEDSITLYVKNYHGGNINYNLMDTKTRLGTIDEFNDMGSIKFQEEYRKRDFDSAIDNDFKLNEAKYYCYKNRLEYLQVMIDDKDKMGYKKYICNLLDFSIDKIKDADQEFEKMNVDELMERIAGKKLFEDEQERLKEEFFNGLFNAKNTNYRKRGIRSINAILEEDNSPYRLSSAQELGGENRKKRYWIAFKTDDLDSE